MKRSREKFCSAEEEENIYVYILLLELNNLKLRSSRYFQSAKDKKEENQRLRRKNLADS